MISHTRLRLREWGAWARGGEPTLSSMFRAMFGRGGRPNEAMPEHIQEIDHIVCIAPGEIRIVLIKFYGSSGTYAEKAQELGLDQRTFKRRIDRADYFVHSSLDYFPQKAQVSR
jgi:hypothetical protein